MNVPGGPVTDVAETDVAETDVAVIGAGPAGLAAALAAADLGRAVIVIDSAQAPGGQIYRPSLTGSAPDRLPRRLQRAAGHRRIRHLPATMVWHAERESPTSSTGGFMLRLTGVAGRADPAVVRARAIVIATGATELALPFPGWDLPGVTTAGAAQALLKGQGVTVGRRVIVAGSGPLLLPVAAGLAEAGVRVVTVLEATQARAGVTRTARLAGYPGKLREAAGYAAVLARHRVPVRTGHAVVACRGEGRVEYATVARLGRDWRPASGARWEAAVDAVHVSFGFTAALELPRLLGCADAPHPVRPVSAVTHDADQATSVAGVFAAGEVTGTGGADVAELEGYLAGVSAARYLGVPATPALASRLHVVTTRLARARRFAVLLDEAYPFMPGWLDWPAPDTVVCRCEETPWGAINQVIAAGASTVRSAKGLNRCGMGYCQARVCGPIVQYAVAAATGRPLADVGDLHARPVLSPVTLQEVADSG